jgi:hypothetical protein
MIHNAELPTAERLLALEIRSQKMGFVVFEGPNRLLDWGVLNCSHPTRRLHEIVAKRVKPLLFRYRPLAVVMRCDNHYSTQNPVRLRISVGAIRKEAHRSGVEFRLLTTKSRKHFFVQVGCDAKHQVAQLIAELFEELSRRGQPKRKAWHSESYHTVIFDAAATGLASFAEEFNPDAVRELIANTESFRRPLDGAAR